MDKGYRFRCSIVDENKNKYIVAVGKYGDVYNMSFLNVRDLDDKNIDDSIIHITSSMYDDFMNRLFELTKDWNKNYTGDTNKNNWTIIIESDEEKRYSGKGGYPENWNEFVDLLILYENYFKIERDNIENKDVNKLITNTTKEISLEYSICGLGKFEKTEISGLKENEYIEFGNVEGPKVKVLKINDESVVLEFTKSLLLGYPLKDEVKNYPHEDDVFIIEVGLEEQINFDPFILPSSKYEFVVTGIYETESYYFE